MKRIYWIRRIVREIGEKYK